MKTIALQNFSIGPKQPLAVICGPCVIESEKDTLKAAEQLKEIFSHFSFSWIFKASYDKANRSSISSFRGPGLEEGLRILERVKSELDVPILTDVHTPEEAIAAAQVCDCIQIPAFLSRQTDLITAAATTSALVNIKKGQFMSPGDMQNVVEKFKASNHERVLLTERGTSFGYQNLVSDFRAIPVMQQFGFPVCFDASHSVQLPGLLGTSSGGQKEFIPYLAKAAVAVGCNALFIEAHPHPSQAKSDAKTVLSFEELQDLFKEIEPLYTLIQRAVAPLS